MEYHKLFLIKLEILINDMSMKYKWKETYILNCKNGNSWKLFKRKKFIEVLKITHE
jgi:hypothetical protein